MSVQRTCTSPDRVDRSKVYCSWESVRWQSLACVESEQTRGVAHWKTNTQPWRCSICGEP